MTDVHSSNYSLRDEIREYWSIRSETFDLSVGHEIFSEAERRGWHRLILRHLGRGEGRAALDLACGTAVISHLMYDLGFAVTGADWSEAMLSRARAKAAKRGSDIRFIMCDAENTMEARGSYDVIITRHLVWTLVDPRAAFAEWYALLKPGGKLLVVDLNQDKKTWVSLLRTSLAKITGKPTTGMDDPDLVSRDRRIRSQLFFSKGMTAEAVVPLLEEAGFTAPIVDRKMHDIHWAQARRMPVLRGLDRLLQDRYAICVTKPAA
ncbi:class I SAM-dependent methyltransferase [Chelatococcus asaccharovorans]|uniref:class I SAM-dependent methyltransferase n=1 Tax=Chelatococcus asaccharovorans TaxID=28210 RepID=UPI00224C64F6|nr:class I SAM-dependent methyltransferase [Chelatococcus asaccharovorans]CAH1670412.1 Ubiquinone/menaquinone biosynthesis C-methylase UbiE [Chelatococcus asaccharovorans]CAH1678125.1 Ubiquinone/menaquinone biosynthesis C-methylase UbiE [Chelatococcus asaccharovorans]